MMRLRQQAVNDLPKFNRRAAAKSCVETNAFQAAGRVGKPFSEEKRARREPTQAGSTALPGLDSCDDGTKQLANL